MTKIDLTKVYAEWLDLYVQPNVVAVFTLKQSIENDHYGCLYRTAANADIIASEYDKFICRLSKAAYGKKNWKRYANRVPGFASLEGNGCRPLSGALTSKKKLAFINATQSVGKSVRYHLNVSFRKPDHLSFQAFKEMILKAWQVSEWSLPDIYIEERVGNFTAYSCKEGPEAILVNSISF